MNKLLLLVLLIVPTLVQGSPKSFSQNVIPIVGTIGPMKVETKLVEAYTVAKVSVINLWIDSPGGEVSGRLSFLTSMYKAQKEGIKIRCLVVGMSASAAFIILAECDERYVLPKAQLLFHYIRMSGCGTFTVDRAKEMLDIQSSVDTALLKVLRVPYKAYDIESRKETLWSVKSLYGFSPKFLHGVINKDLKILCLGVQCLEYLTPK